MTTPVPDCLDAETLGYLWTPDLKPLFWRPSRIGVGSAWYGHIPFAHWIVSVVKPHTLVELGTDTGVSYSAFCEAVVLCALNTRCFAVDTWRGDDQAGYYSEEVYLDFRRFHDERYGAFSELLLCSFDDALPYMPDASVDLLHVDGFHKYEAVKHDFETWQPKLSKSAVVLFHDTNVREREFGVWRLWEELRSQFPSFEFLHGHGLGVLAFGCSVSAQVTALCALHDVARVHAIRERFSLLGERWSLDKRKRLQDEEVAARDLRIQSLEGEVAARDLRIQSLEGEVAARDSRILSSEAEAARRTLAETQSRAQAVQRTAQVRAEAAKSMAQAADARVRAEQAQSEAVRAMARAAAAEAQIEVVKAMKGRGIEPESEHESPFAHTVSAQHPVNSKTRLLYVSGEPDTPGNHYRVVRFVEAANVAGAQASWIRLDEVPERSRQIAETDILVIWRAARDERVQYAVEAARAAGARVVFDIDDLLVDVDLVRVDVIDGIRTSGPSTEHQWQQHCARFNATMVKADCCTVPTEELAAKIREFSLPALVLPNGFDRATYKTSRLAVRHRRFEKPDGLVRIGYAGGSRSHQRDFAMAAEAIARVLCERPRCRLVLFRFQTTKSSAISSLDIEEFPSFKGIEDRIEWRNIVPLPQLPQEMARFDVNIAPLEVGNVFCEAKSELKFFEAALVDVPTLASPTGPYRRAIRDGETGFLADRSEEWYTTLLRLVDDTALRLSVARAAHRDVLWRFGPLRRADTMVSALPQLHGNSRAAAHAFALEVHRGSALKPPAIRIPEAEIVFESDHLDDADITVVVPLHNCAAHLEEALESISAQTLEVLDLVVVDDQSSDNSLSAAVEWTRRHANRFNRIIVSRTRTNAGVCATRNVGVDAAETPWLLLLNIGNKLLPEYCAVCLSAISDSGAAFAYSFVQKSGDAPELTGNCSFDPKRFIDEDHTEIVATVSKEAWAAVGGYTDSRLGEEDTHFCHRLVENGLWGCPAENAPLARYRAHGDSNSTLVAPICEHSDARSLAGV
jgi:glycosyltransferase involved in cell wall biosynthesis